MGEMAGVQHEVGERVPRRSSSVLTVRNTAREPLAARERAVPELVAGGLGSGTARHPFTDVGETLRGGVWALAFLDEACGADLSIPARGHTRPRRAERRGVASTRLDPGLEDGAFRAQRLRVISPECTGCLSCVAACPVKDALGVTRAPPGTLPAWTVPIAALTILLGAYAVARITGNWESALPPQYLRMAYRALGVQ